ncbi:MAG TPA: ferritin family protein [Anaerolineae bacterium]|nr:ferritin family protein [Anaerolineae bacterium]
MPVRQTVSDAFEMAIATERAAEVFYEALHDRFAAHEAVATFWHSYALEEAGHAQRLRRVRENLSVTDLSLEADPELLEMARWNMSLAQKVSSAEIQTLEDAYQLAHEIEHSEVNTVFELLVAGYSEDAHALALVRNQLGEHIDRLMTGFPAPFDVPETRRAVRPVGRDSVGYA